MGYTEKGSLYDKADAYLRGLYDKQDKLTAQIGAMLSRSRDGGGTDGLFKELNRLNREIEAYRRRTE
jgi:hypothetical protein